MADNEREAVPHFDVFISYSRNDLPFARALEKSLESFRPPKGIDRSDRFLRVFRDERDLVGSEYHDAIDLALRNSDKLVVVCSPHARKSDYVNDEIRRFVQARGAQNIVPVLLSGHPNNELGKGPDEEMAFPEALCDALEMPLAVDVVGWSVRAPRIDRGEFESAWYGIVASIVGVAREVIEGRDRKRRTRRLQVLSTAAIAIVAALSGLTVWALLSAAAAREQRNLATDRARKALGQALVARAELTGFSEVDLLERGLLLALESYRRLPSTNAYRIMDHGVKALTRWVVHLPEYGGSRVAFNEDGKQLVLWQGEGVRLLDIDRGREVQDRWEGLGRPLAISDDGKLLADLPDERSVRVFRVADRAETSVLHLAAPVQSAALSSTGLMAVATRGGIVEVRSIRDGSLVMTKPCREMVNAMALSRDGRLVVAGCGNLGRGDSGLTVAWDVMTGNALFRVRHGAGVTEVRVSPDSRYVAVRTGNEWRSLAEEADVLVLSATDGTTVLRIHNEGSSQLVFDSSSTYLATDDSDQRTAVVRIKDASVATLGHSCPSPEGRGLAFLPKSSVLATVGADGLWFWDVQYGHSLVDLHQRGEEFPLPPSKISWRAAVDGPAGSPAAGSSSHSTGVAHLHNTDDVNVIAFSPDNRLLAVVGGYSGETAVWDVLGGTQVTAFPTESGADFGMSVAFSPDGQRVASAYNDGVHIGDIRSGQWRLRIPEAGLIRDVAFSADGTLLAAATDSGIRVWSATGGREILSLESSGRNFAVAFDPTGSLLSAASDEGIVRVWNLHTGLRVTELRSDISGSSAEGFVGFDAKGRRILAATSGQISVWEVASWRLLFQTDVAGTVTDASYLSEGPRLVTVASRLDATTVTTWEIDAHGGLQTLSEEGIAGGGLLASLSPDGNFIAARGADPSGHNREIAIHVRNPDELMRSVGRCVHRNLTSEEWDMYLPGEPRVPSFPEIPEWRYPSFSGGHLVLVKFVTTDKPKNVKGYTLAFYEGGGSKVLASLSMDPNESKLIVLPGKDPADYRVEVNDIADNGPPANEGAFTFSSNALRMTEVTIAVKPGQPLGVQIDTK